MDRGAWWATVHGVTTSWTRLSDSTRTVNLDIRILDEAGIQIQIFWKTSTGMCNLHSSREGIVHSLTGLPLHQTPSSASPAPAIGRLLLCLFFARIL